MPHYPTYSLMRAFLFSVSLTAPFCLHKTIFCTQEPMRKTNAYPGTQQLPSFHLPKENGHVFTFSRNHRALSRAYTKEKYRTLHCWNPLDLQHGGLNPDGSIWWYDAWRENYQDWCNNNPDLEWVTVGQINAQRRLQNNNAVQVEQDLEQKQEKTEPDSLPVLLPDSVPDSVPDSLPDSLPDAATSVCEQEQAPEQKKPLRLDCLSRLFSRFRAADDYSSAKTP